MARIAVVGGGITGLAAAWELRTLDFDVVVFESDTRLGGKIASSRFAGIDGIDEGADAFLTRVPWGHELAAELGLGDTLVSPSASSAFVAWNGALHRIPDGLVLGVPKGLGGLVRSRLLSPAGKARAALEPFLPRRNADHDSLGRLVRDRFGGEVLERLVDPLVGSINAGDADVLSLADSVPQLAEAARRHRSLLLGLRRGPAPAPGPIFSTPRAGMAALIATLDERLRAANVEIRVGAPVTIVEPGPHVDGEPFDAVIMATPAHIAAAQLGCDELRGIPYAGVVMVTMAIDGELPNGSGYLVPKPQQRFMTAASFSSNKWPHWRPGDGRHIVRVSLGRFGKQEPLEWDDERITAVATDELTAHLGRSITPSELRISRWPLAFPQYLPHHAERAAAARRAMPPGVELAGAAYQGIGIPACIRQGRQSAVATARRVLDAAD